MPLGFSNPITSSAQNAINIAQINLNKRGQELGTGKKSIDDIISYILGSSLSDSNIVLKAVAKGVAYGSNVLKKAESALKQMENTLIYQKEILAQASTANPSALNILNADFQKQKGILEQISTNTTFDSRKLLDGSLGATSTIENEFNKFPVTTRFGGAANALFNPGAGATATSTLTVNAANAIDGDTFTVGTNTIQGVQGITYTLKTVPSGGSNEIRIGANASETASNIAEALFNSPDVKNKVYTVSATANIVTLTYVSQGAISAVATLPSFSTSDSGGNVTHSDNGGVPITAANMGAVTVAGMSLNPTFIGVVKPNFICSAVALDAGNGEAAALVDNNGVITANVENYRAGANANDTSAIYLCDINGVQYKGALYVRAANGSVANDQTLTMRAADGSSFSVSFNARANAIDTKVHGDAVATDINALFANNLTFAQTRYISLDNSGGDIVASSSVIPLGNTTKFTAELTTDHFKDLTFKGFTVTQGAGAGQITLNAIISDPINGDRTYTLANQSVNALIQGAQITLTETGGSGDNLKINIGGHGGLTSVNPAQTDQLSALQNAFSKLFGAGGGVELRIGEGFSDKVTLNLSNVTNTKIFIDNNNVVNTSFDILTPSNREKADEILTNALSIIRKEVANVVSLIRNLDQSAYAIADSIAVQSEAAATYTDTSYEEAADAFKTELLRIRGAIEVIIQSYQIGQAALKIISA